MALAETWSPGHERSCRHPLGSTMQEQLIPRSHHPAGTSAATSRCWKASATTSSNMPPSATLAMGASLVVARAWPSPWPPPFPLAWAVRLRPSLVPLRSSIGGTRREDLDSRTTHSGPACCSMCRHRHRRSMRRRRHRRSMRRHRHRRIMSRLRHKCSYCSLLGGAAAHQSFMLSASSARSRRVCRTSSAARSQCTCRSSARSSTRRPPLRSAPRIRSARRPFTAGTPSEISLANSWMSEGVETRCGRPFLDRQHSCS
mmetsp:Transcript_28934/g.92909  ORF Transcript_28934/g.92909 Transcript_28934/m.92909 type:complete len:258 (-) Transcript_28934:611-1384(-)